MVAGVQDIVANMVDCGDARQIRIRSVAGKRTLPLLHVSAKDKTGVM